MTPGSSSSSSNNRRRGRDVDSRQRRNPALEIPPRAMPQEPEDEDRFFVVEKLISKRYNDERKRDEYLVRWQNYSSIWDTWEPKSGLENTCHEMIAKFDARNQDDFETEEVHCICRQPYKFSQGGMIQCFHCFTWFHFTCLQMNMEEANSYAKYFCKPCTQLSPNNKSLVKQEKLKTFYGMSLFESLKDES